MVVPFVLLFVLLLSSCIRISLKPASGGADSSPCVTDWHSGVKTDYSGLSEYKPPEEKYTRLSDKPLSTLTPSGSYGKLLPYIGETMYVDGGDAGFSYSGIQKYGLVTSGGMIVTDPVYSNIYQGYNYDYVSNESSPLPVYSLEKLADRIDEDDPWDSKLYAVCALDGSWITKFEYTSVYYTDKVIFLVRDYDSAVVDVMDYSGKLLYNTKSLSCYGDIPEQASYSFIDGYGEGLVALTLASGRTAYIDVLTGSVTYADFEEGRAFHDGLSPVTQNGLIGYIDKSFSLVIPPQYIDADFFYDGKAVVQNADKSYAVIDKSGNSLFKNPYLISRWDSDTYAVYKSDSAQYYNNNFEKITMENNDISPINDGWFFYNTDTSTVIFNGNEKDTFNGVINPTSVSNGFVSYYVKNGDTWPDGIMTITGKEIVPLTNNCYFNIARSDRSGAVFIIKSVYGDSATAETFAVINSDGKELFSGSGYLDYNPQFDLFEVRSELYSGYIDTSGNYIFKISLLQYIPD